MKKVTLVTLNVWEKTMPLVSGYLQAYACLDPEIAASWEFEFYDNYAKMTVEQFRADMMKADADVYAISCYVWNMGLVKQAIFDLVDAKPDVHILLGGPQVMNHAHKYLRPTYENIVVCNGEGERTFRSYLKALMQESIDFSQVKGLSFYRNGEILTTEEEKRLKDLNEIPSPFLNGLFDLERYTYAMLETNRGCPFTCNYCYWGAATAAKVYRFDEERVRNEIEWISRNSVSYIWINDANWGMLKRDVDLSKHIAQCKEEYEYPHGVGYCTAKNSQARVAEISEIFHKAELSVTHPVSLQTVNQEALRKVNRKNIRLSDYELIQQSMNELDIASYIELIWPLPGETLATFKEGINQLCESNANSFACWPLLLMNNVALNDHREEYGLVTVMQENENSEAEVVVRTKEVDPEECKEGWRFLFTLNLLYCMRGLYHVSRYLDDEQICSYSELYTNFVHFVKSRPDTLFAQKMEEFVPAALSDRMWVIGLCIHNFLYEARAELVHMLAEFVSSQNWWQDEVAQILFEVDLLNQPYLYANLSLEKPAADFSHIQWLDFAPTGYSVQLPDAYIELIRQRLGPKADFQGNIVNVNHRQKQLMLFSDRHPLEHYAYYCLNSMLMPSDFVPVWGNGS